MPEGNRSSFPSGPVTTTSYQPSIAAGTRTLATNAVVLRIMTVSAGTVPFCPVSFTHVPVPKSGPLMMIFVRVSRRRFLGKTEMGGSWGGGCALLTVDVVFAVTGGFIPSLRDHRMS